MSGWGYRGRKLWNLCNHLFDEFTYSLRGTSSSLVELSYLIETLIPRKSRESIDDVTAGIQEVDAYGPIVTDRSVLGGINAGRLHDLTS